MHELFANPRFNQVHFGGDVYDDAYMQDRIRSFRDLLRERTPPGSPFVYLFAANHIKTLIAYFGAIQAGYIVVLVDPQVGTLELAEMIEDAPPATLIRVGCNSVDFEPTAEIEFRQVDRSLISWDELEDVCTIVYTNAEDGYAKGAMLTTSCMAADAEALAIDAQLRDSSVVGAILPLDHVYALQTNVLSTMVAGASMVIHPTGDLRGLGQTVERFRSVRMDVFYSVPLVYYLLSKVVEVPRWAETGVSFVSGAYSLPTSVRSKFFGHSGVQIQEGYGLAEASPICTWQKPGSVLTPGSVGPALGCCCVRVLAPDGGDAPAGVEGRIEVKGTNIMKGYYRAVDATARTICGGWLRTGDVGYVDKLGHLTLTGRTKRVLKVGGHSVFPAQLERWLREGAIARSVEVQGTRDPLRGDTLRMVLRGCAEEWSQADELRRWVRLRFGERKTPSLSAIVCEH